MIGGLISGLGSVASGLISNSTNRKIARETNAANIQMNQANNDLQRELAAQKYDKDLEQWHRENEYNTPAAQVERMKEAGLNPALSGNITTGIAASSPEMPLANTTAGRVENGALMQPLDFTPFGQMFINKAQSENLKADTDAKNIDNMSKHLRNMADLQKAIEDTNSTKLKNLYQGLQNNAFSDLHNMDMRLKQSELDLRESQRNFTIMQNAIKAKELQHFDNRQRVEIANIISSTAERYANVSLSKQQRIHLVMQDKHLNEMIKSAQLDRDTAKAVQGYVIKQAEYAADTAMFGVGKARNESLPNMEYRINSKHAYGYFGQRFVVELGDLLNHISPFKFFK